MANANGEGKEGAAGRAEVAGKELCGVTIIGIVLLVALAGLYVTLHIDKTIPSYDKESARIFFSSIAMVKAATIKSPISLQEVAAAVKSIPDTGNDILTSEFKDRIGYLKGLTADFSSTAAVTKRGRTSVSAGMMPQKAAASGSAVSQADQRVVIIRDEIEKIEKDARAISKNDGFFWFTGYWKWLEIVFWGEFGVIIGILAWVSSQAEQGKYTAEMHNKEKYWYIVEVVMGPIVVMAVFFLLRQLIGTVVTGLTQEDVQGSIYTTLGVAFTLGLFIRRTLGIFDTLKDKLPLPKGLGNKGARATTP